MNHLGVDDICPQRTPKIIEDQIAFLSRQSNH
jgi:hypothetical protein